MVVPVYDRLVPNSCCLTTILLLVTLLGGCENVRKPLPPEEEQAIFIQPQKHFSIAGVILGADLSELQAICKDDIELEASGANSFRLYDHRSQGGVLLSVNESGQVISVRSLGRVRLFLPDGTSLRRREPIASLERFQLPAYTKFAGGRSYSIPDGTLKLFVSDETVRLFVLETSD